MTSQNTSHNTEGEQEKKEHDEKGEKAEGKTGVGMDKYVDAIV